MSSKIRPEPTEQLADMREHWEAARKALDSDRQYRQARKDMCNTLLREAKYYIRAASDIFERNPDLKGGDSFRAFEASLRVAFRNMQLALRDPAVVIGTPVWRKRVKGGEKRALERWGKREAINEKYKRFARRRDGLGDFSKPADIYDEFVGECRDDGLDPPLPKTFRNKIAEFRAKLGLE